MHQICDYSQVKDCFQIEVIHAFAILKKAAAQVNMEFGLPKDLAEAIQTAADEVGLELKYLKLLLSNKFD